MAEDETSPWARLVALWRLSRPRFWVVSALPAYVGYVLATRTLVPGLDAWREAQGPGELVAATGAWLAASSDLLVGLATLGPLLWTATLLVNDAHDLATDRRNARKASSPLVQGVVSAGWAEQAAHITALVTLVAASLLDAVFLGLVSGCLVLAWAYSVPPVRLKSIPGADVAVNAIGIGVLAGLAGWSLARPLAAFPFAFLPQGLLVAVAIYVPTTIVDLEADQAAGEVTIAVALGAEGAYQVGWWAWLAANAGALVLAWRGWLIPRSFLPVLVVFVPLLVWEYHTFVGRAPGEAELVRGIFLCALTFTAVNLLFAMVHTGWLPL